VHAQKPIRQDGLGLALQLEGLDRLNLDRGTDERERRFSE
jgi:hypothetical protein